jgi:hypothetical protein
VIVPSVQERSKSAVSERGAPPPAGTMNTSVRGESLSMRRVPRHAIVVPSGDQLGRDQLPPPSVMRRMTEPETRSA